MDVFSVVIDTKGAIVPYIDSMNDLVESGVRCICYATDDMQDRVAGFKGQLLLDDYNLGEFVYGHNVFDSANNALKLFLASQHILSAWTPHIMASIQRGIEEKLLIPENTLVVSNTVGMMYLGHFLLELGFQSLYVVEPYRFLDWKYQWGSSKSQFIPPFLPEKQFIQLAFGRQGKQLTEKFFGQPTNYRFEHMQAAIQGQILMYSPQLCENGEPALGYPYPNSNGDLDEELQSFIQDAHKRQQTVLVFTLGSMDVAQEEKAEIINEFIKGVQGLGLVAIILGWDAPHETIPDIVFANRFVRYDLLFPLVDVIVEHCGAGSTHLALWAGKPVLAVPFLGDQFDWAKRLDKLEMLVGHLPKAQFNQASFIETFKQGYTKTVIEAARQAGERERALYSNGTQQITAHIRNAINSISRA
jgi:hypothetical protein